MEGSWGGRGQQGQRGLGNHWLRGWGSMGRRRQGKEGDMGGRKQGEEEGKGRKGPLVEGGGTHSGRLATIAVYRSTASCGRPASSHARAKL